MTLELDEETLAQLGWATSETNAEREHRLRESGMSPRWERDVGFAERIDGRHKSRDRVALSVAYRARRKAS